jgi:hypothetical protein
VPAQLVQPISDLVQLPEHGSADAVTDLLRVLSALLELPGADQVMPRSQHAAVQRGAPSPSVGLARGLADRAAAISGCRPVFFRAVPYGGKMSACRWRWLRGRSACGPRTDPSSISGLAFVCRARCFRPCP